MAYRDIIAHICIESVSDEPIRPRSSIPNYNISIESCVDDKKLLWRIIDELRIDDPISSRAVMNNVDADERSYDDDDILDRTVLFGELARLACYQEVLELLELPDDQLKQTLPPRDYDYIKSLDIDELNRDFDKDIDRVIDMAEPNITAYLFGRDVVELDDIDIHIRENFYRFTTCVIYHAFQHLVESSGQWIYVFEACYETNGILTGTWELDTISLFLKGDSITNFPEEMIRGRY